jgi:hypothetical protein
MARGGARRNANSLKRQRTRTRTGSTSDWEDDLSDTFTESLIIALQNDTVKDSLKEAMFSNPNICEAFVDPIIKEYRKKFEDEIKRLTTRIDDLEQYSRRSCALISGIVEREGENTDAIVLDTARLMGLDFIHSDTCRSHRVGRRLPDRTRDLIVKFVRHNDKYEFYWRRFRLAHPIYIREALTPKRSKVFYEARCAKKRNEIVKTWTNDGQIFIESNDHKVTKIASVTDLSNRQPDIDDKSDDRPENSDNVATAKSRQSRQKGRNPMKPTKPRHASRTPPGIRSSQRTNDIGLPPSLQTARVTANPGLTPCTSKPKPVQTSLQFQPQKSKPSATTNDMETQPSLAPAELNVQERQSPVST